MADPAFYFAALLAVGATAGLLAGLLGVGGGLIVVPALTFLLSGRGVAPAAVVHTAVGTSLATIALTSIASVRAHNRAGAVAWERVRRLAPPIGAGALVGALAASRVPGEGLQALVGLFELAVAVRIGFSAGLKPRKEAEARAEAPLWGVPIGALSALVGVGGGTLTVPYLIHLGEKVHRAVGTGAACGLPIALAGSLGFALTGSHAPGVPSPHVGYIHLPAFAAIAAASWAFAPWGARLAHRLPADALRRVFAVFLALVGTRLLMG
jgi:uncharacterized membrane protein YfcA